MMLEKGGKLEAQSARHESTEESSTVFVTPEEVNEHFTSQTEHPEHGLLNLLNLQSILEGHHEGFLDRPDFRLMQRVVGHGTIEQRGDLSRDSRDASISLSFTILGKMGCFSMPHRDHHGKITVITTFQGQKLWPVCIDDDFFANDDENDDENDVGRWTAIYLDRGDVLIQPGGTVHAPFSLSNVLCGGSHHIPSQCLLASMKQSIAELDEPATTNDDPEADYVDCAYNIARMWMENKGKYTWGTHDELVEFVKELKVSWKSRLGKYRLGCSIG